jgi:unsaturated rhamnogalacturonyl hydrolase
MRMVWAVVMVIGSASSAWGQDVASTAPPAAPQNAVLERVLRQWPAGKVDTTGNARRWGYEEGVLLDGVWAEWRVTGDGRLFKYVKDAVDAAVDKSGTIHL